MDRVTGVHVAGRGPRRVRDERRAAGGDPVPARHRAQVRRPAPARRQPAGPVAAQPAGHGRQDPAVHPGLGVRPGGGGPGRPGRLQRGLDVAGDAADQGRDHRPGDLGRSGCTAERWGRIRRWPPSGWRCAGRWPAIPAGHAGLRGLFRRRGLAGPGGGAGLRGRPDRPAGRPGHRRPRPAGRFGRAGRRGRRARLRARAATRCRSCGSTVGRPAVRRRRPGPPATPRCRPFARAGRWCCSATPPTTRPRPCCWAWAAGPGRARSPACGRRRPATCARCWACAGPTPRPPAPALGLPVWQDPHNGDPRFRRVRLRTEVLPLLEDVLAGGVTEALARTAEQLQRRPGRPGRAGRPGAGGGRRTGVRPLSVAALAGQPAAHPGAGCSRPGPSAAGPAR